ncbi:RIP metalloprotease RseP [Paraurantiacibacter namhicola]|uniref:Zinc metalloprotease n=1 Tax=Paraurantiacibacter namhicola TaxID=645517 RepID=A0A1C7D9U1_9SPHN|nr:RIP metalloprotease RseP [Paraurantiacibacter namhicola]ANU08256.1 Metalloprotease MmpA [Paraurantiacibacter namhicola]
MFESTPVWMWVLGFLLVLGPLVTLHELGHYLVGRWFGVGAQAFSVGFGKELAGFTDKRGTRWKLSALPLGGYVQFKGDMNPASVGQADEEAEDATFGMGTPEALAEDEHRPVQGAGFHHAKLWQRALIVAAGPVMNLLIAIVIFAAFFAAVGKPAPVDPAETNVVRNFAQASAARDAGLEIGDRIVAIDGDPMVEFQNISDKVIMRPNKRMVLEIERDGKSFEIPVVTEAFLATDQFGNKSMIGRLGIFSNQITFEEVGVLESIALGWRECVRITRMMILGIGQIITGKRSVKELGGPIKISKYAGEQLSLGAMAFVSFAALISLNLAFINLLPIPALDGGHLAFYAAEAIRRKPASPRSMELAYRTGIALVLALMLFVTVNDIASLPVFGG